MTDEPHAVVRLLLARIESHPEEFRQGGYRWRNIIDQVTEFGLEIDKKAMDDALRAIRLTEAHEEMMDELINGEDRRRKEEEDRREYMESSYTAPKPTLQQHQSAVTQALTQYPTQTTPFRFPLGDIL